MTSPLKHLAEYYALRAIAAVVNPLPYPAALAVGWVNAAILFRMARRRAREAKARIRGVLGERVSRREVNRVAWLSWRNIVFNGIEMMRMGRLTPAWAARYVEYGSHMDALKKRLASGKGAIVAVPHMGSWELGLAISRMHDIPMFSIEARQKNPYVNAYIHALRTSAGTAILERGAHTMREVLRRLRAGEVLAILPDVRMPAPGIRVPFLGGEANLGKGMALFAVRTGVPIFPAIATREGWTRHHFAVFDPVVPDAGLSEEEDVIRMTTAVLRLIDNAIRRNPEQWFWHNKRWILDPVVTARQAVGSDAED
ncbi:MAG: lysophospholipid acyltransferase family protein [Verrucomicrobiota bacterium]|nr:lysophospholipid acyltransferase family protein [Verrucomicrobiota bacterium]